MKLTKPQAAKAAELFGLSKSEQALLNEVPHRGTQMPPTDPLIYRFYELVMVNGPALKELIEEEFGDGIMSAIDFDLAIERLPDPKGDRVKLTMSGKFLPYKYYGATGNARRRGLIYLSRLGRKCGEAIQASRSDRSRQRVVRSNDLFTSVTGNADGGDRRSSNARGQPTDPKTAYRKRHR